MELRSSRSRSKTPFSLATQATFANEFIEKGNHVEKTVVRTTRRTTTSKTSGNATSSTEEFLSSEKLKPTRKSTRSDKSIRQVYKTSDYSSEDGENEVTSTRTISQNDKNQLIEDARAAANGTSEVSALDLYIKSGRYWEIYPKTDWTYSPHSRDRVELAPGIVAMPNMSRRTIHSVDASYYENTAHKTTNTDQHDYKSYSTYSDSEELRPKQLFNNNHEYTTTSTYAIKRRSSQQSYWMRIRQSFVSVFTSMLSVFYFVFKTQTSWFAKLHRLSSRVMLLDTWLLRSSGTRDKVGGIVALCLLPLILFGGWWLLSSLGGALYGGYFNSTTPATITINSPLDEPLKSSSDFSKNNFDSVKTIVEEKVVKITEKIYVEPPGANEIAAELTPDQLAAIADAMKGSIDVEEFKTEAIVAKIVQSPSFQSMVTNYNLGGSSVGKSDGSHQVLIEKQQEVIDGLRGEIEKIREELLNLERGKSEFINHFTSENAQNFAQFNYGLRRCCQKPIIDIEGYVTRILTKLLNNPDFLRNQQGFSDYLHSIFLAKQDLELILANLTRNLHSEFDALVKNNGQLIMDDVTSKLSEEVQKISIKNVNLGSGGSISDERVRQIVKNTLAIYDADKTGLVDYAMEPMGGQIVTTRCTENYHSGKAVVSVLGIPLWYPVNSPRTVITPGLNPGQCWAFQNFPGFLVVKLSGHVQVEAFSLEHISKLLVPNGRVDSAPKNFEVYGLKCESDRDPIKLGEFVYEYEGEPLQYFAVQNEGHVFDMIELRVLSNNGNPNYTCLYRFRVHGKLISTS